MKNVFAKIAKIGEEIRKVELAQEAMKVEFDAVSDSNKYLQKSKAFAAQVKKLNKDVTSAYNEAKSALTKSQKASQEVSKVYDEYMKMIDEHRQFYAKISQDAKRMGLDIKKTELYTTNEAVTGAFFNSEDPLFVDGNLSIKEKA